MKDRFDKLFLVEEPMWLEKKLLKKKNKNICNLGGRILNKIPIKSWKPIIGWIQDIVVLLTFKNYKYSSINK